MSSMSFSAAWADEANGNFHSTMSHALQIFDAFEGKEMLTEAGIALLPCFWVRLFLHYASPSSGLLPNAHHLRV